MDDNWKLVHTSDALYKAEIIKDLLENENIIAVIINKRDSSYQAFGEVEVYTKEEDVEKAKEIIKKAEI